MSRDQVESLVQMGTLGDRQEVFAEPTLDLTPTLIYSDYETVFRDVALCFCGNHMLPW